MDILSKIKEQVAQEWGNTDWNDFQEYYLYWDSKLEEGIDQIAIRYAQEQKRELMEMLEMLESCLSFVEELNNHGITNWSDEVKLRDLITKHKQS